MTQTTKTDQIAELIAAAAVVAGDRAITRRLEAAVSAVYPDLAADVAAARRGDQRAAPLQILPFDGHRQPAPVTAADRVWTRLDADHGPAITRAALTRLR